MRLIANQGLVRPCTAVRTTSAAVAVRASIAPAIRCRYSLRTMSKTSSVGIAAPKLPVTRALRVGPKRGTAKGAFLACRCFEAQAVRERWPITLHVLPECGGGWRDDGGRNPSLLYLPFLLCAEPTARPDRAS